MQVFGARLENGLDCNSRQEWGVCERGENTETKDLTTKAKYFAAAVRHALRKGGGGTFSGGGVGISLGGGLNLVINWLMASGRG